MENCNNHDHNSSGECLIVEWTGAAESRPGYEKAPNLKTPEQEQEEIRQINANNKKRVKERLLKENVAPW